MSDASTDSLHQRILQHLEENARRAANQPQATWIIEDLAISPLPTPADRTESTGWNGQGEVGGAPARAGRFEILGLLGRGGMGQVLLAHDPELRRYVAVKVALAPESISESQLARLIAEAQTTSQLEHPNIVPVYDMGFTDAGSFTL